VDKYLILFLSIFSLYLLWRIDRIERERPSYEDIKNIFEMLVEKVTRNEYDRSL